MKIKITSDSTCDLSREQIARYDIEIMPLAEAMGGNNYRDGVDIAPSDIYSHVDRAATCPRPQPTTSPTIRRFLPSICRHMTQ